MSRAPRHLSLALAASLLTGCAAYTPAPIQPGAFSSRLDARSLPPRRDGAAYRSADLLAVATAQNAALAQAEAAYRNAQAAAHAARVGPSMTLSLTLEYARDPSATSAWTYGLGTDIPIDAGGRRATRLTTADLNAAQARLNYEAALWRVRTAVRQAVIARKAAEDEHRLAEVWLAARQARADRLERRLAAGEDSSSTVLLARADVSAAERRLREAEGRRAGADVALAQALGVSPHVAQALDIAADAAPAPLDLSALKQTALVSHSDVLKAVIAYDLAEAELRSQVARQYPEVRIGPGYTWERGLTKLPFNLSLVLPPTDLNRAGIAQAEAQRAEAGRALEATQSSLAMEIGQAEAGLVASEAVERRIAAGDLPVARRQAELARRLMATGEADMVDSLQAEAAVTETELALIDARRARALAATDLEAALRRSFAPDEDAMLSTVLKSLGANP